LLASHTHTTLSQEVKTPKKEMVSKSSSKNSGAAPGMKRHAHLKKPLSTKLPSKTCSNLIRGRFPGKTSKVFEGAISQTRDMLMKAFKALTEESLIMLSSRRDRKTLRPDDVRKAAEILFGKSFIDPTALDSGKSRSSSKKRKGEKSSSATESAAASEKSATPGIAADSQAIAASSKKSQHKGGAVSKTSKRSSSSSSSSSSKKSSKKK